MTMLRFSPPDPRSPLRRRVRVFAALVALSGLVAIPAAQSQDEVEDNEAITDARAEREDARLEQIEAELALAGIDAEDETIIAALEAATELVHLQEAKIDAAEQRLVQLAADEELANERLVDATEAIDAIQDQAVEVAVQTYIGQTEGRVESWLASDDATDAIHRVALLETVGINATDTLDQLRALEEVRTSLATDAETARTDALDVTASLAEAKIELDAAVEVQAELKAALEVRRTEWEAALADWEAEEQALTDFIIAEQDRLQDELEERRRVAAAAAAAASSNNSVSVGVVNASGWTWPTSGGAGSGYGQRLHPVLGYYRLHSGLDIGGSQGNQIWAATEGVVISAGWNGGYGNAVIIQHANNVTTLYAHMSNFNVSVGDYVFTGDVVGYVGSTGLSTGPHLHFEVRINGGAVDPRPYLP